VPTPRMPRLLASLVHLGADRNTRRCGRAFQFGLDSFEAILGLDEPLDIVDLRRRDLISIELDDCVGVPGAGSVLAAEAGYRWWITRSGARRAASSAMTPRWHTSGSSS